MCFTLLDFDARFAREIEAIHWDTRKAWHGTIRSLWFCLRIFGLLVFASHQSRIRKGDAAQKDLPRRLTYWPHLAGRLRRKAGRLRRKAGTAQRSVARANDEGSGTETTKEDTVVLFNRIVAFVTPLASVPV